MSEAKRNSGLRMRMAFKAHAILTEIIRGGDIEFKNNSGEWEPSNNQDLGIIIANLHRYRVKPAAEVLR